MLKFKLIIIVGALLLPTIGLAQNTLCSGKGGGIARCDGSKFVCNDGSYNKSKKDCPTVFGNESAIPNTVPTDTGIEPNLPDTGSERTGDILKLDYEGFTVWLDCSKRAVVKFATTHNTTLETKLGRRTSC